MKNAHFERVWFARVVGALALIASTTGCGVIKTLNAAQSVLDGPRNDVTEPDIQKDLFLSEASNRFGLMALFAFTAYRYDLTRSDRDQHGCDYLKPDAKGDRNFGMPRHVGTANESSRWERWVPMKTDAKVVPCFNTDGLFYETYVHRDSNQQITEAVIAYRGTENRDGQAVPDWATNLSNFFGFEPKQYKIARRYVKDLTDGLNEESKGVPIYAVGHSLGGGLAQQAGYLSKRITAVYTFNTSPVTNWTHLRLDGNVDQGYPFIHRVYNGGEGLAGIRGIATAGTSARYGRYDIGVQFGPNALLSGHAMEVLACNFAQVLSETNVQEARHKYPTTFIKERVLTPRKETQEAAAERRKTDRRVCDDENK
ncbi:MAG: DUF2974 domain-containing protein [Aquabacterium sp.]|nr:DUF2974 domain-containing protein [Aquabacterium sp.]